MNKELELTDLQARLRALAPVPAPDALWERLQSSLDQLPAGQGAAAQRAARVWSRRPSPALLGLALAACSAMLFLWFFWLGPRGPEPVDPQVQAADADSAQVSLLQAASADLERVLDSGADSPAVYGDDQAWVEHTLQLALANVDAELATQPAAPQAKQLWTQRVALLAGLAEQSRGTPLGSGVEWVQLN